MTLNYLSYMCYRTRFAFPIVHGASCSPLRDPMDCRRTGCSVSGVSQESIWSGCHFLLQGSSRPREEELGWCVLWIKGKGEVMKHKPFDVWVSPGPVQFSGSVVSNSLRPHGRQHARPPCPSPTPGAYSNSCPLSR